MLKPFLLIGVGGSGGKTLRAVRQGLLAKLRQEGWNQGIPEAWQFLHIDSPLIQDGKEFPANFLPSEDYLSIVSSGVDYATVYKGLHGRLESKYSVEVEKPLPSPREVTIPVELGAGAYRAIGRTISAAALDQIHSKATAALTRMQTGSSMGQLKQLTQVLGMQVSADKGSAPVVILISSIAGGSGAGMFIDVAEAVKSAAKGQPWADRIFSLLYAPDVFEEINNMGAIAPNALGAIAETMSGYWNSNPSEATSSLYRSSGLISSQTAATTIGPAFTYIIGRKNGSVDFGSQSGVYKATAASVSTWMTSDKVQDDMSAYAVANFKSKAVRLKDETNLKRPAMDAPPFSSLGFARVSLGMEKFAEYASERIARQTLQTILERHLESDPNQKEKTSAQWVTYHADSNEGRFLEDSKLNELTENNNQVVDALQPDMTEPQASFKVAVQSQVEGAGRVPAKGLDYSTWVQWISNAHENNLQAAVDQIRALRNEKIRKWVADMPNHLVNLTTKYIGQLGLPVTAELVRRLIEQTKASAAELIEEKNKHFSDASYIQVKVSGALEPVATQSQIMKNHPTIAAAYYESQVCLHWRAQAELKEDASKLLADLNEEFLVPLYKCLVNSLATLTDRVDKPKLLDERENPYTKWPDFSSKETPEKFKPAPNERLLIDYRDYPSEFDALVNQTINDPNLVAKRAVIDEVILGADGIEALRALRATSPEMVWQLLKVEQKWIPKERAFQNKESAPSTAKFSFEIDHMDYLEFARRWLYIPGRAFRAYLDQKIATYLGDESDKNEQSKRFAKFAKEFQAAVASADPLVQLDNTLVTSVHGPEAFERSIIFSPIPVSESSPLYDALKDTLVSYKYWNDKSEDWFVGPQQGANARYVDIFTQTAFPLQPIVMSSVMDPIAKTWNATSKQTVSRTNFMKWRRARSLAESIPAAPQVWQQMLRGWYVARLLNQVKQDSDMVDYDQQGPRISIWVDPGSGYLPFPHPLYYPDVAPISDLPGIVLESMVIAMANCYSERSLKPLEPYQRMLKLGGTETSLDSELARWVLEGDATYSNSPDIKPDRAGSPEMTLEDRKSKICGFFVKELDAFKSSLAELDKFADPRTYPISWEIRNDIERALENLISSVRTLSRKEEL